VRKERLRRALEEVGRLDRALYRAVTGTRTPLLDGALSRLSRAADYSRLSLGAAAGLAVAGGHPGRRAAGRGLASVVVTAGVVNLVLKPIMGRRRPDLIRRAVPLIRMPRSRSFPSGHTAAAFAFAAGADRGFPGVGPPLYGLAALVGYSRIHTGVHYPLDVCTGALFGMALAEATNAWIDRMARTRDAAAPAS
jgi:membrane-associated phospholipid phosphatase